MYFWYSSISMVQRQQNNITWLSDIYYSNFFDFRFLIFCCNSIPLAVRMSREWLAWWKTIMWTKYFRFWVMQFNYVVIICHIWCDVVFTLSHHNVFTTKLSSLFPRIISRTSSKIANTTINRGIAVYFHVLKDTIDYWFLENCPGQMP